MNVEELNKYVPDFVIDKFKKKKITNLNPAQIKAINKGLLEGKNLLVCTPTGSGKTAIATIAITKNLTGHVGSKALYLVPLKALANEKHKDYEDLFIGSGFKVGCTTGDLDSRSEWLGKYDLLILTVEKLDSIIRHGCPWLNKIKTVIIDEVHLINDTERGPTLEILITMLKQVLKECQIIALSATIGNPDELAGWLGANLVIDKWRPVKLFQGTYLDGKIEFF